MDLLMGIKIKSIERTLLPLIQQISTLVQHRSDQPQHGAATVASENALRAIGRVGQSVNLAMERFVAVADKIGDDNPDIKQDMYDACKEARTAGHTIERLCEIAATDPLRYPPPDGPLADRGSMVRAARSLLSSVTRVLLLADIVVVKQLLLAKDRVARTLSRLESVANFTEFVRAFSVFGTEMVELATVTGERQNDLKEERRRAQMAAARQVLERSTILLLTSSKTCLRHPESMDARENRDTVFCQMRRAMDLIHYVVKDGVLESCHSANISTSCLNGIGGLRKASYARLDNRHSSRDLQPSNDWDSGRATVYTCLRQYIRMVESIRPRTTSPRGGDNDRNYEKETEPGGGNQMQNTNNYSCNLATSLNNVSTNNGQSSGANSGNTAVKKESQASATSNGGGQLAAGSEGSRRREAGGELTRSSSVRDRHMRSDYHHNRDGLQYAQLHHHQSFHGYQSARGTKSRTYSSLDRDATRSTEGGLQPYGSLTVLPGEMREQLLVALDKVIEKTQDFTDSAYTTHEHRENILLLCDRAKLELNQLLRFAISCEQYQQLKSTTAVDLDHALECVLSGTHDLSQQLLLAVGDQVNELEHILRAAIDLVSSLRAVALNQEVERLQESADRFHDYIDHILDVCRLLRHVAFSETLQVHAKFMEINLKIYGPQVLTAARVLSTYPASKAAKENLDVFTDMWKWIASDVTSVSKEVIELAQQATKPDKFEYQSLPRPGKHGTTSKPLKPTRLDQEEQEKIAKTGMEMKMVTNEMDAETDKWNNADENNDIVKRAKNMSAMAGAMYQFTKGEGTLKTTQDLFTQAEYFAEEANRLYKVVRQFSYQVPVGQPKKELSEHVDKVPPLVQTLQFSVKEPTVGKAATFVKVDHVIQETKNLMNVISKVVNTCFECANKYQLDFSGLSGKAAAGSSRDDEGGSSATGDSKGTTTNSEGGM